MIDIKTKTDLKLSIIIWNVDFFCFKSYYLSYNISAKMYI